jgi:hypothetical protein
MASHAGPTFQLRLNMRILAFTMYAVQIPSDPRVFPTEPRASVFSNRCLRMDTIPHSSILWACSKRYALSPTSYAVLPNLCPYVPYRRTPASQCRCSTVLPTADAPASYLVLLASISQRAYTAARLSHSGHTHTAARLSHNGHTHAT